MKKPLNNGLVIALIVLVVAVVGGAIAYSLRDPNFGNHLGELKPGGAPLRPRVAGGGVSGGAADAGGSTGKTQGGGSSQ